MHRFLDPFTDEPTESYSGGPCIDCGYVPPRGPVLSHPPCGGSPVRPAPFARSYDCEVAEPLRGSVTLDALVTVSDASRIAAECRTAAVVTGEVTFFLVNGVLRLTIDNYTVFG